MDYSQLVEQARELSSAMRADESCLHIESAEDREAAARYDDLGQVLNERDVPRYEDTGDPDDAYEADVDTRVGWVLDDLDRARARVAELEDGIRKALHELGEMGWVDASHIPDGEYASLVTVEDYRTQERVEEELEALLDGGEEE